MFPGFKEERLLSLVTFYCGLKRCNMAIPHIWMQWLNQLQQGDLVITEMSTAEDINISINTAGELKQRREPPDKGAQLESLYVIVYDDGVDVVTQKCLLILENPQGRFNKKEVNAAVPLLPFLSCLLQWIPPGCKSSPYDAVRIRKLIISHGADFEKLRRDRSCRFNVLKFLTLFSPILCYTFYRMLCELCCVMIIGSLTVGLSRRSQNRSATLLFNGCCSESVVMIWSLVSMEMSYFGLHQMKLCLQGINRNRYSIQVKAGFHLAIIFLSLFLVAQNVSYIVLMSGGRHSHLREKMVDVFICNDVLSSHERCRTGHQYLQLASFISSSIYYPVRVVRRFRFIIFQMCCSFRSLKRMHPSLVRSFFNTRLKTKDERAVECTVESGLALCQPTNTRAGPA